VQQCPTPLPAGCAGYKPAVFAPPTGCPIADGIVIPPGADDCAIQPGTCPANACQWICAIATNDPPQGVYSGGDGSGLPTLPAGYGGVSSEAAPADHAPAPNATAGDAFLGSCAAPYADGPSPAGCDAAGPELRDLAAVLSLSPQLWTAADGAQLAALCDGGCVSSLAQRFGGYASALSAAAPPPGSPYCNPALAPNLPPLAQLINASMCLSPPGVAGGGACAPAVARALQNTSLLQLLLGLPAPAGQPLRLGAGGPAALSAATPQLCAALASTGCCGVSALEAAYAAAQMSCRPKLALAIQRLAAGCSPALPPPCPGFAIPAYLTSEQCTPARWPHKGCPLPLDGECPATACELACAAVRPGDAASPAAVAAAWPGGKGGARGEPVAAASYITACLEQAAGAPFTPACAATYPDMQALLGLALRPQPGQAFGPSDAAVLRSLCTPRGGSYPCLSQLAAAAGVFFNHAVAGGGTCDAHLGPNLQPLASAALQFACLTSDEHGGGEETSSEAAEGGRGVPADAGDNAVWCLPAAAAGLAAGNLTALLTAPWTVSAAVVNASAPAVCAGMAAARAGCCAPSLFASLQLSLTALCMADTAAAVGAMQAACAAPPLLLPGGICPSMQLPPIKPPPPGCSLGVDWAPASCGLAPASCPATPCQLLCAVATNDPPANASGLMAAIGAALPPAGSPAAQAAWAAPPPAPTGLVAAPGPTASRDAAWGMAVGWSAPPLAAPQPAPAPPTLQASSVALAAEATRVRIENAEADADGNGASDAKVVKEEAAAIYLTGCLDSPATNKSKHMSSSCASSYQELEEVVGRLLASPTDFPASDSGRLATLCAARPASLPGDTIPSCVDQYRIAAEAYLGGMTPSAIAAAIASAPPAPPSAAACDALVTPQVAQKLVGTAAALVCATDAAGALCLPLAASALSQAGLWSASALTDPGQYNASAVCSALASAGCCGAVALNAARSALGALCQPGAAQLAQIAASCPLPAACASYTPPLGLRDSPLSAPPGCAAASLPTDRECAMLQSAGAACPATPCALLCAAATLDPPRDAAGGPTVTFGDGASFSAQSQAAGAAQLQLSSDADRYATLLSLATVLGLACAHAGYRRRAPPLALAEAEGGLGTLAAAAALPLALACAALAFAANACLLPSARLCCAAGRVRLPLPLRVLGVVTAYVGLGAFTLAASQLRAEPHGGLCREGLYGVIRHPQLAAAGAVALGALLGTCAGLAAPFLAAAWLLMAHGALREEEAALRLAFGAKWEAYAAGTPALLCCGRREAGRAERAPLLL